MGHTRLVDVFYLGPFQIYVGNHIKGNNILKYFMYINGVLTILFNGHNYLYINRGVIKKSFPFVHDVEGKFQIQRLYNILIMYPLFFYASKVSDIPESHKKLFRLNIIVGFLYNLFWFSKLSNSTF